MTQIIYKNCNTEVLEEKVKVCSQNHSQHSLLSFSNINKIVPCYSVTFSYKIYISMSVLITHLFFFKLFILIFYFILKVIVCIHHKNQINQYIQSEVILLSLVSDSLRPYGL